MSNNATKLDKPKNKLITSFIYALALSGHSYAGHVKPRSTYSLSKSVSLVSLVSPITASDQNAFPMSVLSPEYVEST